MTEEKPAQPTPRRVPRDLDTDLRAAAYRLTVESGEVVTPSRLLAISARRGLALITADDVRRRPAPRGNKAA